MNIHKTRSVQNRTGFVLTYIKYINHCLLNSLALTWSYSLYRGSMSWKHISKLFYALYTRFGGYYVADVKKLFQFSCQQYPSLCMKV